MTGVPASRHVRDLSGVRTCTCSRTCSFAFLIYVFIYIVFIFPGVFGSVWTKPESWLQDLARLDNNTPCDDSFWIRLRFAHAFPTLNFRVCACMHILVVSGRIDRTTRRWRSGLSKETVRRYQTLDAVPLILKKLRLCKCLCKDFEVSQQMCIHQRVECISVGCLQRRWQRRCILSCL